MRIKNVTCAHSRTQATGWCRCDQLLIFTVHLHTHTPHPPHTRQDNPSKNSVLFRKENIDWIKQKNVCGTSIPKRSLRAPQTSRFQVLCFKPEIFCSWSFLFFLACRNAHCAIKNKGYLGVVEKCDRGLNVTNSTHFFLQTSVQTQTRHPERNSSSGGKIGLIEEERTVNQGKRRGIKKGKT